MVQIEDALITGVLREKVGVELAPMEPPSWLGWAWHTVLSQCPWMTITKLTFSNNLGRNPAVSYLKDGGSLQHNCQLSLSKD